jgi:type I restriction enzyme S subunit
MTEWPLVRLGDIAADEKSAISKPYGSAIIRDDYRDAGVPVVRGVNLARGRFYDDEFVFISEALADRMPGARLQPGDLVFTHRGSVGQISMIPRAPRFHRYTLSTSQVKARLDPTRAIPEFFYYWFLSPAGRHSILQSISTVGVPGLARPVETIKSLPVPLPPLDEQRRIAGALGALDDLIDTNRDLCDRLRRGAAASYSLALESAGFDEVPLEECARFYNRGRIPLSKAERSAMPGPYPYYGATGVVDTVGRYLFDAVHILVGEDGSVIQDDGSPVVQMVWGKYWVNNHAHVLSGAGISDGLLRQALLASNVAPLVTGAVQAKLSMGRLKTLRLRLPSDKRVSTHIDELAAAERELSEEIVALTRTRDELLPLLLSGRVRVDGVAA